MPVNKGGYIFGKIKSYAAVTHSCKTVPLYKATWGDFREME